MEKQLLKFLQVLLRMSVWVCVGVCRASSFKRNKRASVENRKRTKYLRKEGMFFFFRVSLSFSQNSRRERERERERNFSLENIKKLSPFR